MPTNIKHQPVQFGLPALGEHDAPFSQLIHSDDKINFQVLSDLSDNLVTSPMTWGSFTGTVTADQIIFTGNQNANKNILTVGEPYKVTLTVEAMPDGGTSVFVLIGTGTLIELSSTGYYELYGVAATDTDFQISSNDGAIVTNDVTVQEIEEDFILWVTNEAGQVQTEIQTTEDDRQDANLIYQDADVPSLDCFRVAVGKETTNQKLTDSDFDDENEWSLVGGVAIGGSSAGNTDLNVATNEHSVSQVFNTGDASVFKADVEIDTLIDVKVRLRIFDTDSNEVASDATNSTGTFSLDDIYLIPNTDYIAKIEFEPDDGTNEIVVSSFEIFEYSFLLSNVFKKITNTGGTLHIEATNDEEAFGFHYDNDFTFNLRISAALQQSTDEPEVEIYRDSRGARRIVFADAQEILDLAINPVPEYIHRALRTMRLHDTFLIDTWEYVTWDENYDTDWQDDSNLAGAMLQVSAKTEDRVNN